jgi:O-antigen/teichoic acid export membrane protein
LLRYAIPYGVICCASAFVPTMERALVNGILGNHELGLYAAGAKLAMLTSLVISAFQTAWGPFALAIHKEPNAIDSYNWVLKGFALCICTGVLLVSAMAGPLMSLLASDRYAGAAVVVFPLAMGLAVQATSWITEVGIDFSKKSYLGLYGYALFVSVTAISIYVFATRYGLWGAALGVMLGHIAKAVTASWLAQRAYPLRWVFGPVVLLMAGAVVFGLLGAWANATLSPTVVLAMYGAGALTLPAAGWFLLFGSDDRRRIISEIRTIGIRLTRSA